MKILVLIGLAAGLAAAPLPAEAQRNVMVRPPITQHGRHIMPLRRQWPVRDGRWIGGWSAPGGWHGYRRPHVGFTLPRYWIAPSFHIVNYGYYGFRRPHPGTGWSRYYDDAVLIDGRGHVYDQVHGVDWDRYDGHDDDWAERGDYREDDDWREGPWEEEYRRGDTDERRGEARKIGAGVVGGAIGGLLGNRIAGRGNRTEGTLIGAGVGALAGLAAGSDYERRRNHPDYEPYPYGEDDYADYDNPYERVQGDDYAEDRYDEPPRDVLRHGPPPRLHYAPVTSYGGVTYRHTGPGTTTIIIQPAVTTTTTTTTTTFVEEVAYAPPRKAWRRR